MDNLRSGIADLPLHGGKAPSWLFSRMVKLGGLIIKIIIKEYGVNELLKRLADPFFLQALGNVLGYDWHSSGVTTVTLAALKEALNPEETGIAICGGKGKYSLQTTKEIKEKGDMLGLSTNRIIYLQRVSRLAAKVDNAALQDGFTIYHHVLVFTENGGWTIVQQGMNTDLKLARRYHWYYMTTSSFVENPHFAIIGIRMRNVLNMVDKKSREAREVSVDLVRENPKKLAPILSELKGYKTLDTWLGKGSRKKVVRYLKMPWNINWNALKRAYELQPMNYEELLLIRGIGPSTIRALALISDIIYGAEPSWKDPVKYSFAFGGKDGVPFPVNIRAMDEAIDLLENVLTTLNIKDKDNILRRIRRVKLY